MSEQLASLRGLESRLGDVQRYLAEIAQGTMPLNHAIAYHLQDALNLLPDLRDPALTGAFATSTNDELLVVYLSSLVRAVLAGALLAMLRYYGGGRSGEAEDVL